MQFPFTINEYINHGTTANVFRGTYKEKDIAIKIGTCDFNYLTSYSKTKERIQNEYNLLQRLQGIDGIPKTVFIFKELEGTFDELNLGITGKHIEEMTNYSVDDANYRTPYFCGAFGYEYIPANYEFKFCHYGKLPPRYIDQLEKIVIQAHQRGLSFPKDSTILIDDNSVSMIDWTYATDLTKMKKKTRDEQITSDMEAINRFRKQNTIPEFIFRLKLIAKKLIR